MIAKNVLQYLTSVNTSVTYARVLRSNLQRLTYHKKFGSNDMALTKFSIKISRGEYELISRVVSYAAAAVDVVDLATLFEKETLEDFKQKFDSKKFKLQDKFCFSFSSVELAVFMRCIGGMMEQMGDYERAVYRILYNTQIAIQVSRAIQIRFNYNS